MEFDFLGAATQMTNLMDPKKPAEEGDSEKLGSLMNLYLSNLPECDSTDVLLQVLQLDDFYLPVDVVKATFERLLGLGHQTAEFLEKYATWLYLNGPDWDDLADEMMKRVRSMEESKSE